ncbi:MAG: ABC transporter permease [Armatimonadetes bacterium]|nr:ABC transporter permease [Armatimonadota bacterium]
MKRPAETSNVPSRLADFWRRYRRNRAAVVGLAVLSLLVALAAVAPLASRHRPFQIAAAPFQTPRAAHPMGTDDLGRDLFSGVVHGARSSLLVGLLASLAATAVGVLVGAAAGYHGGRMDDVLMRVTEFFLVIPAFLLALVLVAVLKPSVWNLILVIGALGWPSTARLVRAEFLSLREREFVMAARAIGVPAVRLIFRGILPNALPPVVVASSLGVAAAIIMESGLSFIGLGDPNLISWGYMLGNARPFLRTAWWMPTFPGLAIFLAVLSINLVGDGLNDALNPRLRSR